MNLISHSHCTSTIANVTLESPSIDTNRKIDQFTMNKVNFLCFYIEYMSAKKIYGVHGKLQMWGTCMIYYTDAN